MFNLRHYEDITDNRKLKIQVGLDNYNLINFYLLNRHNDITLENPIVNANLTVNYPLNNILDEWITFNIISPKNLVEAITCLTIAKPYLTTTGVLLLEAIKTITDKVGYAFLGTNMFELEEKYEHFIEHYYGYISLSKNLEEEI